MSDDYERVKKWCADPRSMPCAPYNSICRVLEDYDRLLATLKTAEKLAVKHAQEAGLLAAELDALRKQEPSHYAVLDDSGEILAADTSKRALLSRGCAALGPTVELYAAPAPVAQRVPERSE